MQNTIDQSVIFTLSKIKEKGYIPSKVETNLFAEKINALLSALFKKNPVKAQTALRCMENLAEIARNTPAFLTLCQRNMMDLYDYAITEDDFTTKQAETKLLFFFSCTTPDSIEGKNRLLGQIQQMTDFKERKHAISQNIFNMMQDYDSKQQFQNDPNLSILEKVSSILHRIAETKYSPRIHQQSKEEQEKLSFCASVVKKYNPQLFEGKWETAFKPSTFKTTAPHSIGKEPALVYLSHHRGRCGIDGTTKIWERS